MLSSPLHHPSGGPPPPLRGGGKKLRSRDISCPSFALPLRHFKIRSPRGSGAPRGACQPCPRMRKQVYAVCATHLLRGCALLPKRRARLSALTLAALATGYHPDGSAPEPGFLKTRRIGVLPVRRIGLELSTLRADRSFWRSTGDPEPPGSGLHHSGRGHRPLLRPSKVPRERRPL